METEPKLTEEQKNQIKTAHFKFTLKSLWNGVQHGIMGMVLSTMLSFAMPVIFDNDTFCFIICSIAILALIITRINAVQKENVEDYKKEIEGILKR